MILYISDFYISATHRTHHSVNHKPITYGHNRSCQLAAHRQYHHLCLALSGNQSQHLYSADRCRIAGSRPLLERTAHGQIRARKTHAQHREPPGAPQPLRNPLRREKSVHGRDMVCQQGPGIQHRLACGQHQEPRRRIQCDGADLRSRTVRPAHHRHREISHQVRGPQGGLHRKRHDRAGPRRIHEQGQIGPHQLHAPEQPRHQEHRGLSGPALDLSTRTDESLLDWSLRNSTSTRSTSTTPRPKANAPAKP